MKIRSSVMAVVVVLVMSFSGSVAWGAEKTAAAGQAEDGKWLFLCYWELNESMPVMQHVQIAKELTEAGLFPPEGVEIIRFDKTPGDWGVIVFKTDSPEAAFNIANIWRLAIPGFFNKIKISPAMPVRDAAGNVAKLYQGMKAAEAKTKKKK